MKKLTKRNIKHYSRRYAKSKAGSTLIELIAVIAILAITSSSCLSAMFAMVDVAKRGQQISESQRICALLGEQFSLYGNTAKEMQNYNSTTFPGYHAYPSGFMDATNGYGDYVDYFVSASSTQDSTIVFSRFDTTNPSGYGEKSITTIDGVKEISFEVSSFECYDAPGSTPGATPSTVDKFILRYTITTIYDYTITGGVVMNNVDSPIGTFTNVTITTKTDTIAANDTKIRIRSTNRELVDRS